jgi:hypothetical protein
MLSSGRPLEEEKSIITMINFKKMKWLWHVERMEDEYVQDIGEKIWRKETARNIQT